MKINKLSNILVLTIFIVILFITSNAIGGIKSKISDKVLNLQKLPQTYSFVVAGHTYGTPSASMYPAASLMGSIPLLNSLNLDFMMLLGDVIQHQGAGDGLGELETQIFKKSLIDKLEFPVFNSPGNHDLGNPDLYEKYFGETYFHFQKSSELYVVLNTQLGPNFSNRPQIDFILNLIKLAAKDKKIKNVFIFHHTTVWAVDNYPINTINPWTNGPASESNDYEKIILPALNLLAKEKGVYLLSGDIGIRNYKLGKYPQKQFGTFFQKHNNITYIATGLSENNEDSVVKVDVSSNGEVLFKLVSLSDTNLLNIEEYNLEYWKNKNKVDVPKKQSMLNNIKEKIKFILLSYFSLFVLGAALLLTLAFLYIIFLRHQLTKK